MVVISNGEAINFNDVSRVFYRASVFGDGYPIEIKRKRGGLFNDAVEIARVETQKIAEALVREIAEKWGENAPVFDIDSWVREKSAPRNPNPNYIPPTTVK